MVPRYARKQLVEIWQPENKFKIWLEIELLAMEAWANLGEIPPEAAHQARAKAQFNVERIDKIEREVKHDVIAFLTCVAEYIGPQARFMHKGLTSSDVLDTCLAYQLKQATEIIQKGLDKLLSILKLRAYEFKNTVQIGRSHGIHGEPITFGLKLALWYAEMARHKERLAHALKDVACAKVSGAMGTFANVDPAVEAYVAKKLGLEVEPASSQIVQRDRHAYYFSVLAGIGASLEKIATEIRHLQRTEVYEAEEFFSSGQKGSSAMPHKRNPVLTENVTGLARLLRGYALSAFENVALWHERDISHSSVERVIGPDATILADFMIHRMTGVIEKLMVYPERMQKNLDSMHGLVHSQRVLLALTNKGVSRENAYRLVQKNAMKVWQEGAKLLEELSKDSEVTNQLDSQELSELFDLNYHTKHVDTIFKRVFGE